MKDWAMRNEPSASKKSGGFSQQGYGFVKTEFLRLSADLRKKFNVIFLFHAAKDRQGDDIFYDIVCEGSAKTLVWQPADLGAYLHIVNGERYLGFTPTMNYNAKAAYGIKGLIKVPELKDGEPNDFLTRLFFQVKANIAAEKADAEQNICTYQCPNCGAPIGNIGQKICEYCGTVLYPAAPLSWMLFKISESK